MSKSDATDAARALAARRQRAVIVCEVCQQERTVVVMGKGRAARTCGPTCRSKLHRREKKAKAPSQ